LGYSDSSNPWFQLYCEHRFSDLRSSEGRNGWLRIWSIVSGVFHSVIGVLTAHRVQPENPVAFSATRAVANQCPGAAGADQGNYTAVALGPEAAAVLQGKASVLLPIPRAMQVAASPCVVLKVVFTQHHNPQSVTCDIFLCVSSEWIYNNFLLQIKIYKNLKSSIYNRHRLLTWIQIKAQRKTDIFFPKRLWWMSHPCQMRHFPEEGPTPLPHRCP